MVAVDHILQGIDRARPIVARLVRIDRAGVEQFARGIYNGNLTTCAKAWVEAEDGMSRKRGLAKKRA